MSQEKSVPSLQRPGKGILGVLAGFTYPLRALGLFLRYPHLRGYVLIPILVNLVVGITIYAALLSGGLQLIDFVFNNLPNWIPDISQWNPALPAGWHLPPVTWPGWLHLPPIAIPVWLHWPQWQFPTWLHWPDWQWLNWQWPNWQWTNWQWPNWQFQVPGWVAELPSAGAIALLLLLRLVLVITLFLVTGFIFLQFGVLLGSPWYGKLSEEIEKLRTGKVRVVEVGLAQDVSRAVFYEVKKLILTMGLGLPLLLLHLFPGVGTVFSATGGLTLAATVVCMDFFDAAIERRRPSFRQKLGIVWRSFPASGSFALVCLGLVSIPFINLLGIPLCVAAGTLFVCDRVLPWLEK